MSWSYCRRSVDQFVMVSGSPLGPITRFYPYPFFSYNCLFLLHVGRLLWREDGSVTYSADWSGHWGPITIAVMCLSQVIIFIFKNLIWKMFLKLMICTSSLLDIMIGMWVGQRRTPVYMKVALKVYPRNRPWRPIGLWDVEDPTLSRQSTHS
jgi:hypothetical protein